MSQEDQDYEDYLKATGRDPAVDPTLRNGKSAEPSDEVLQETIRRGEEATERLREAGYDSDNTGRQYAADGPWTDEDQRLWERWEAIKS